MSGGRLGHWNDAALKRSKVRKQHKVGENTMMQSCRTAGLPLYFRHSGKELGGTDLLLKIQFPVRERGRGSERSWSGSNFPVAVVATSFHYFFVLV